MKISEIIACEDYNHPKEVAILKENVRDYINASVSDQGDFLAGRAPADISPDHLHKFFRICEREENTCLILQYLLMFSEKVPGCEIASPDAGAAEKQLREFVRSQVNLLLEKDVRKAIMREYSQLGILKAGNFWYYEGRIDEMHRELTGALDLVQENHAAEVVHLCGIREKLCLFWFDICREDVRRVRTGDLYMYKLALILQKALAASRAR
jgi:hypothetical protein